MHTNMHIQAHMDTHALGLYLRLPCGFGAMRAQAAVSSQATLPQKVQATDAMTNAMDWTLVSHPQNSYVEI